MLWKLLSLCLVTVLGLFALGAFGDRTLEPGSGNEFVWTAVGFLLFTSGLLGLIAVLARSGTFLPSSDEMAWWERKRVAGRRYFVREVVVTVTVVGGTSISALILYNSYRTGSLFAGFLSCIGIWILLAVASYAVGVRLWRFYEGAFETRQDE